MNKDNQKSPWGLVLILVGAGIISAFQVGKVPPLILDIRSELGISLVHAGWILSIFNTIGLLLGACAGAIADTLGHRRLLITGIALQALGNILGSLFPSFFLLLVSRVIEGAGFLAVIVSTPTLIFQVVTKKDFKVALSIWSCYLPAGAALIMVLIPIIINHMGWQKIWLLNGIFLGIYALILFLTTRNLPAFQKLDNLSIKGLSKDIKTTATSIGPLLLTLIFITYALQWLAVMGFLPTMLFENHGFSKAYGSILTAIMVSVNIIGNLVGGRLLKKGANRSFLITVASFVMGSSAILIYNSDWGFFINYSGCILFSLFGGLIPATILGAAPVFAPTQKLISTTTGMIIQGGQLGQACGPIMIAWIVSYYGSWSTCSWFLAGVALLGIILSLFLLKVKPVEQ